MQWTIRCPLPFLQELVADDLDVAVSVELDELKVGSQTIRLLHNIRLVQTPGSLKTRICQVRDMRR